MATGTSSSSRVWAYRGEGARAGEAQGATHTRREVEEKLLGDTLLLDSFHLPTFLEERRPDGDHVLYYPVHVGVHARLPAALFMLTCPHGMAARWPQDTEVAKRGILEVDPATSRVTAFLEKPKPTETASRLACPAVYVLRNSSLPLVHAYLEQPHVRADRDAADAPGRLIQWLVQRSVVYGTPIEGRHDLGNLADYQCVSVGPHVMCLPSALTVCTGGGRGSCIHRKARSPGSVIERAYARIGLIGNPSDGFNGKTLAVALEDYYATVHICPASTVELVPHPVRRCAHAGRGACAARSERAHVAWPTAVA